MRGLISLRAGVEALRTGRFPEPGPYQPGEPVADTGLMWFDPDGSLVASQDWDNPEGRSFSVVFPDTPPAPSVLAMLNAYWEPVAFTVPTAPSGRWTLRVDTMREDGSPAPGARFAAGASISVGPRSIVIATG